MAGPHFLNLIFISSLALTAETSSSFESLLLELDRRDRLLSELQLILEAMDDPPRALPLVSQYLLFQCFL
jgi:hypothetical protein